MTKTKHTGRPSKLTQEIADAICDRLVAGESLKRICRDPAMPAASTVFSWIASSEAFGAQYALAKSAQMEALAEEILEIADDGSNDTYVDGDGNTRTDHDVIARSRLRVDARKWLMSKLAPKRYGERLTQELTGPAGSAAQVVITLPDNGRGPTGGVS